jgi:hypothetical protein
MKKIPLTISFKALFLLTLILLTPLISANNFGYNYLDNKDYVIDGANYSINVNNTEHLQGRDTNALYNYFKGLYDSVYYSITNPFGYYNSTTLPTPNLSTYAQYEFGANNFNGSGSFTTTGDITSTNFIGNGQQLTDIRTNMLYDTNAGSTSIFAQNYELVGSSSVWVNIIDSNYNYFSGYYSYATQHNGFPTFDDGNGHNIYFDSESNYWVMSSSTSFEPISELADETYLISYALTGYNEQWNYVLYEEQNGVDGEVYAPTYIGDSGNIHLGTGSENNYFAFFNKAYDETLEAEYLLNSGFSTEVGGKLLNFGGNFGQLGVWVNEGVAGGFFRIDLREDFKAEFFNLKYAASVDGEQTGQETIFGVSATGEVWGASAGLFGYGVDSGVSNWDGVSVGQFNGNVSVNGVVIADDFLTNSKVADISLAESSLSKLDNMDKWLNEDKEIQYNEHYAFVERILNVTDYSKPVYKIECQPDKIIDGKIVTKGICEEKVFYPYRKEEKVKSLSMETRVAEMEKMIKELYEQNKFLQEQINNLTGKDILISEANTRQDEALCSIKLFSWCIVK